MKLGQTSIVLVCPNFYHDLHFDSDLTVRAKQD
jgi:hypothetical protein